MNPEELLRRLNLLFSIRSFGDLPGERVLREGEGEGGSGGGGGGNPPAKTFTQDEVNAIVQKRLSEVQKKFADYDQLKEAASKVPDFERQMAELNEKLEMAGKSEQEKAKLVAEKLQAQQQQQLAALTKERDDAKAAAEQARNALRTTNVNYQLTNALTAAKALPGALTDAVEAFVKVAKIETDDADRITSIEVDGVPFTDATKAAEAFLKIKQHFAAAPVGGGGTRSPNSGPGGRSFDSMNAIELAELALTSSR